MNHVRYFRRIGSAAAAVFLTVCVSFGQTDSKKLAVVNGEVLTDAQIRSLAQHDLDDIEIRKLEADATYVRDQHTALEDALNKAVEQRVLQAEAKKRGLSETALTMIEVDAHVTQPTDADAKAFYDANKARISGPTDPAVVLPQVKQYLAKQRRDELYAKYIETLKKEYNVQTFLEPQRTMIPTDGFPTRGPQTAPVTIVEFSDFECPFCGNLFPIMAQIEKNYGDKIRVVYRQFPLLNLHPHAQKAAEASLCAYEQQKFWEMHDAMFTDQKNLTVDDLKKKAEALKMDPAAFGTCLDSGKEVSRVQSDIREGAKAGVSGTPAMFINGRYLNGVHPYEEISKIIDEELQKGAAKQ